MAEFLIKYKKRYLIVDENECSSSMSIAIVTSADNLRVALDVSDKAMKQEIGSQSLNAYDLNEATEIR